MRYAIATLLLLLTACSGDSGSCARLPGGASYCLQMGALPSFASVQRTSIELGDKKLTLITRIEGDGKSLRLLGMTPFGQTILSVSWENGVLKNLQPALLNDKIDPVLLVALIQVGLWPADAVRDGLDGLIVVENKSGRHLRMSNNEHTTQEHNDMLSIVREGDFPYSRLIISAPEMHFRLESRQLDDDKAVDAR